MSKNYWSVTIDDVDDPYTIYEGPSMKEAIYKASHLRGIDGRNSYVVWYHNGTPAFYLDENDLHEAVNGVVCPFFA